MRFVTQRTETLGSAFNEGLISKENEASGNLSNEDDLHLEGNENLIHFEEELRTLNSSDDASPLTTLPSQKYPASSKIDCGVRRKQN